MELFLYVACLLAALPVVLSKPYNVTVDDTDPSITWSGNWASPLPGFGITANGTYMTAKNDPSAWAEFKFTGVAVYFVSARWPYDVSTRITLNPGTDNAVPLVMDLSDYSTEARGEDFGRAMYLAAARNLEYKEHTVRVDVAEGGTYAIFDAFVYTALSETDPPVLQFPNEPVSTAFTPLPETLVQPFVGPPLSPTTSYERKKKPNVTVIVAPICSVVGALMIGALAFLYCRRQSKASAKSQEVHGPDVEAGSINEKQTDEKFDDKASSVSNLGLPTLGKTYEASPAS